MTSSAVSRVVAASTAVVDLILSNLTMTVFAVFLIYIFPKSTNSFSTVSVLRLLAMPLKATHHFLAKFVVKIAFPDFSRKSSSIKVLQVSY